jgi:hypothetical protein
LIDKDLIGTVITVATATATLMIRMNKMVTKDDFKTATDKIDAQLSKLVDAKADKAEVNQRLISIETTLRIPQRPQPAPEPTKEGTTV